MRKLRIKWEITECEGWKHTSDGRKEKPKKMRKYEEKKKEKFLWQNDSKRWERHKCRTSSSDNDHPQRRKVKRGKKKLTLNIKLLPATISVINKTAHKTLVGNSSYSIHDEFLSRRFFPRSSYFQSGFIIFAREFIKATWMALRRIKSVGAERAEEHINRKKERRKEEEENWAAHWQVWSQYPSLEVVYFRRNSRRRVKNIE